MNIKNKLTLAVGLILLQSHELMAQEKGLGKVLEEGTSQLSAVKDFAIILFGVVGFIAIGFGLLLLRKESKEEGRGHGKNGLVSLLIGAALMSVSAVSFYLQETI